MVAGVLGRPRADRARAQTAPRAPVPGRDEDPCASDALSAPGQPEALQSRFPKEKAAFTPTQLLLDKAQSTGQRRLEKVKYKGVTPRRGAAGKIEWQVQKQYDTPQ